MAFAKVENCLANIARHWLDPKYDVTQRDSDISFYEDFFERPSVLYSAQTKVLCYPFYQDESQAKDTLER